MSKKQKPTKATHPEKGSPLKVIPLDKEGEPVLETVKLVNENGDYLVDHEGNYLCVGYEPWKVDLKDLLPQLAQPGQDAAPWWKRVGRYFVRNHKWLIAAIIVPIVVPIIVLLVTKKLGN